MSKTENREEMVQEYLEYNVPQSHRQEVRSLGELVNRQELSRRGFLSRTSKLGIGLTAGSTILTALTSTTATKVSAAAAKGVESGKIADKYKNLTIGVPVFAYVDENQITIANQIQAASQAAGLNWKLLLQDVAGDPGKAQQVFDAFITQGVNVIIDIVTPPRLVAAQMAKAKEKKIPVFGIYTFGTNYPDMVLDYGGVTSVESSFVSSYMLFDQRIRHPGKKKIKLGIIDSHLSVLAPGTTRTPRKFADGTGKVLACRRVATIRTSRYRLYRYGTVSYRNLFPAPGGDFL